MVTFEYKSMETDEKESAILQRREDVKIATEENIRVTPSPEPHRTNER